MFFNVCLHSCSFPLRADIGGHLTAHVDGEPQGNWRWNSNYRDVVSSSPSRPGELPRRLNKLRHPQLQACSRGNSQICTALVCNFWRWADRLATLFECSLNFPCASYLDIIQCIPNGKMSQCYINIANILEIHLLQKPREAVMASNNNKGKQAKEDKT